MMMVRTVTVDVSSATTYSETGESSVGLSDISRGDTVGVTGTQVSRGVIDALSVQIVPLPGYSKGGPGGKGGRGACAGRGGRSGHGRGGRSGRFGCSNHGGKGGGGGRGRR
jgi:hypothetical protein